MIPPTTLQRNTKQMVLIDFLFKIFSFFLISFWFDISLIVYLEIFLSKHTYAKLLILNFILLSSKSKLTKPWYYNLLIFYNDKTKVVKILHPNICSLVLENI